MSVTLTQIKDGCVIFKLPDEIHNNYGLQICSQDNSKVLDFHDRCLLWFHYLKNTSPSVDLRWFHQGGYPINPNSQWYYFELWNGVPYQDMILEFAEKLASALELPLYME